MNEEQDNVPSLIPISKKKTENNLSHLSLNPKEDIQSLKISPDSFNSFLHDVKKVVPTSQPKDIKIDNKFKQKEKADVGKIEELEKKFRDKAGVPKKNEKLSTNTKRNQQNEKSKYLISEMLSKIAVKNMSEQLYPASNEVIDNLLGQIELQIKELQNQAGKKQSTLQSNSNNQRLKKQIEDVKKSIDHCVTIKELYHQKINFRNKITILQGKIQQLKVENRDLKIRISKGIQTINGHMHNLPCQREKELEQQLNKSTIQLKQQKQMRNNLQKNINEIILNFKRLYEEADTARLIVVQKLKDIQERERKIEALEKMYSQSENQKSISPQQLRKSSAIELSIKKNNEKDRNNQRDRNVEQTEERKTSLVGNTQDNPTGKRYDNYSKTTNKNKVKKIEVQQQKKLSMEDQIAKMRNNQLNLLKATKKL